MAGLLSRPIQTQKTSYKSSEAVLDKSPLLKDAIAEQRKLLSDLLGQMDAFGESQRARIDQDFENRTESVNANLISRGLGSSSLLQSTGAAMEDERQLAMLGLEDQLLGRRQGIQMQGVQGLQQLLLGAHSDYTNKLFQSQQMESRLEMAQIGAAAQVGSSPTGLARHHDQRNAALHGFGMSAFG